MSKRANNEGSVFKRADGKWIAQITNNGKRPLRVRESQEEAIEALKELHKLKDSGVQISNIPTFSAFVDKWYEAQSMRVAINTQTIYEYVIRTFLKPYLGKKKINQITRDNIQDMYRDIQKVQGKSANLCRKIHQVLTNCMKLADSDDLIKGNPCRNVIVPTASKLREVIALEKHEYTSILNLARKRAADFYPIIYIALETAMRRGELCGLQWKHINFNTPAINVQRQVIAHQGQLKEAKLKTKNSFREIILSAQAVSFLRHLREQQEADAKYYGYTCNEQSSVFRYRKNGNTLKPDYLSNRFKLLCAQLPENEKTHNTRLASIHTTRHTHATMLLRLGIQPKVVQERLGHSTIAITMDTYSHLLPSIQAEAMLKFTLDYQVTDSKQAIQTATPNLVR